MATKRKPKSRTSGEATVKAVELMREIRNELTREFKGLDFSEIRALIDKRLAKKKAVNT